MRQQLYGAADRQPHNGVVVALDAIQPQGCTPLNGVGTGLIVGFRGGYDVEKVSGGKGRANALSVEERTRLTALFCQTIQDAGYKPMIYHNMEMATLMLDLGQLEQYDKWFAYYNDDLYYPYAYKVWQYTEKGVVACIDAGSSS